MSVDPTARDAADASAASFQQFAARLASGEDEAAREFFARYSGRLVALARSHLAPRLRPKEDPEDVLQSVMRTFFRRLDQGDVELRDPQSLWGFLATMTLWKCGKRAEFYAAARRSLGREVPLAGTGETALTERQIASAEPSPHEVAALSELVDRLLYGLDDQDRRAVELLLEGESPADIAARVGCSRRTVYRTVERIRAQLLSEEDPPQ